MSIPAEQISSYGPAGEARLHHADPPAAPAVEVLCRIAGPQGPPKLAFTIDEFVDASGVGRTNVYKAMKEGRLRAVKAGSRTLIPIEDAIAFMTALPPARPHATAA